MFIRHLFLCFIAFLFAPNFYLTAKERFRLQYELADTAYSFRDVPHKTKFVDSLDAIKEIDVLLKWLLKKQHSLSTLDSISVSGNVITAHLYAGPRFTAAGIATSPELVPALSYANLPTGKKLTLKEFEKGKPKIIGYYANHGYPFARLYMDSITFSGDTLFATLACNPMDRWHISDVIISGNVSVADRFVYEQINIAPGDVYSENNFVAIQRQVESLDFVSLKSTPVVQFHTTGQAVLLLDLQKERANTFDGIVGFAPNSAEDESLVVTGNVNLVLHNTLKHGEYFAIQWEKLDAYSQNAMAETYFKYIYHSRLGSGGGIAIEKQDTSFLNTQLRVNADYFSKYNSSSGLQFQQWQNDLISDIAYDTIREKINVLQSKIRLFGVQLQLNRLDYKLNPSKGIFAKVGFSAGTKQYSQTASVPDSVFANYSELTRIYEGVAETQMFTPIALPVVGMAGVYGKWLHADDLFDNELYRIGGANSLRGFNEQSIYASAYGIATIELRLLFEKKSNLYAFYDQAYYIKKTADGLVNDSPFGFGFGMNIANKNSIFRISYAVGKQFDNPLLFSAGKIHFGYANRF